MTDEVIDMATITRPSRRSIHSSRPVPRQSIATNESKDLRQQYALSQHLLARLLGVSVRTISTLESGTAPTGQVRRNLTQVSRLCAALAEAMLPRFVGEWLDQPNEMLGGLKPVEAIERGQIDRVWQVAEGLRSGAGL